MNINGKDLSWIAEKSPLGLAVMEYLIVHRDEPITATNICDLFWNKEKSADPVGALRTLISRFRVILKGMDPDLSKCIITYDNCYQWKTPPNTIIDLYEIQDIMDELDNADVTSPTISILMQQLLSYYRGMLLKDSPYSKLFSTISKSLQKRYKDYVLRYIHLLQETDQYSEIIEVYQKASCVFPFDNELNQEMQKALLKSYQLQTTKEQYKYIAQLNYNYLHINPGNQLQTLYNCSFANESALVQQYNEIQNELISFSSNTAFCCDFLVFKEMYDLLSMNLTRLKIPLCLGIAMFDASMYSNKYEQCLQEITEFKELMQHNLRKGDIMCQCSPTLFAVLLPSANERNAGLVMERIQHAYYLFHPQAPLALSFRVVSLITIE